MSNSFQSLIPLPLETQTVFKKHLDWVSQDKCLIYISKKMPVIQILKKKKKKIVASLLVETE